MNAQQHVFVTRHGAKFDNRPYRDPQWLSKEKRRTDAQLSPLGRQEAQELALRVQKRFQEHTIKLHCIVSSGNCACSRPCHGASALELWTVSRLETMYRDSVQIKCPFFRRRASDLLEGIDMMARFLVIRHKSILDLPLGSRIPSSRPKSESLDTTTILSMLSNGWKPSTHKGCCITGRLNQTIYRDDCLFDGPDPDMPVKGLAKHVKASKDLFDYDASCAKLIELKLVDNDSNKKVQARWKLQNCVLRLPWRPMLPTWTGTTT